MTTDDVDPVTSRQLEMYRYLGDFQRSHGYMPTIREICEGMGFASLNAAYQKLIALERKGWIQRKENTSRAIRLTGPARPENHISDRVSQTPDDLADTAGDEVDGRNNDETCRDQEDRDGQ